MYAVKFGKHYLRVAAYGYRLVPLAEASLFDQTIANIIAHRVFGEAVCLSEKS